MPAVGTQVPLPAVDALRRLPAASDLGRLELKQSASSNLAVPTVSPVKVKLTDVYSNGTLRRVPIRLRVPMRALLVPNRVMILRLRGPQLVRRIC